MKQLVIEKKLNMCNNVVEKVNQDFEGDKKYSSILLVEELNVKIKQSLH